MKQYLLLSVFLSLFLFTSAQNPIVEVYYFHADERCESDLQIEQETKNVIDHAFKEEIANGTVVLHIVNFMSPENQAITDKFEIGWSSLVLNKIESKEEEKIDINEFAFTNIPANPDNFRSGLEQQIRQILQNKE